MWIEEGHKYFSFWRVLKSTSAAQRFWAAIFKKESDWYGEQKTMASSETAKFTINENWTYSISRFTTILHLDFVSCMMSITAQKVAMKYLPICCIIFKMNCLPLLHIWQPILTRALQKPKWHFYFNDDHGYQSAPNFAADWHHLPWIRSYIP